MGFLLKDQSDLDESDGGFISFRLEKILDLWRQTFFGFLLKGAGLAEFFGGNRFFQMLDSTVIKSVSQEFPIS